MFGFDSNAPERVRPSLDNAAQHVLATARSESERLGNEYLGCEHLALALLNDTAYAAVLQRMGVDLDQASRLLGDTLRPGRGSGPVAAELPVTSRTKKVFEFATQSSRSLGRSETGVEHLLVGMIQERLNIGAQVFVTSGLREADVHEYAKHLST